MILWPVWSPFLTCFDNQKGLSGPKSFTLGQSINILYWWAFWGFGSHFQAFWAIRSPFGEPRVRYCSCFQGLISPLLLAQMAPNDPHWYWMFIVCSLVPDFVAFRPFWAEKQLQYLAMGPPTGLQMARNYPKRSLKAPTNTAWLYSVPLYIILGLSGLFV